MDYKLIYDLQLAGHTFDEARVIEAKDREFDWSFRYIPPVKAKDKPSDD